MSDLEVLVYPHKGLRLIAPAVTQFDDALRDTVKKLFIKLQADDGVGLAATQVGIPLRVFVMNTNQKLLCFINPEIVEQGEDNFFDEGCLSFPGIYLRVKRASSVTVKYQDEHGHPHIYSCSGTAAECIQHELDHLNGVLFIDYLSKLKRMLMLKKYEKIQRKAG